MNNETILNPKMTSSSNTQQRRFALISGFGLLLMTVFIILAEVVALAGIVVEGDAAQTTANILANQRRFRIGMAAFLGVAFLDLVVAWAFYIFLKPARDHLSRLAAWSRLVYTIILIFAIINLSSILQLLGSADYLAVYEGPQHQAQVMHLINTFRDTWDVGYIFFGIHLLVLGVVVFRSGFCPKLIGLFLTAAGVSYLVDYLGWMLFPHLKLGLSYIFGYGELIFMLWLLVWGGKKNQTPAEQKIETNRRNS